MLLFMQMLLNSLYTKEKPMFDADKIRSIRKERGISQQRLSDLTGIPVETIASWEQHRSHPINFNDINNIAIALDCYIDDFLEDGKYIP